MRILVVGCGSIGRRHIRLLKEMGVEVRGFDSNEEAARVASDIAPCYWSELNPPMGEDWDGIIIATPSHTHSDILKVAADLSGCPVLVEKPLAHSLSDAQAMLSAAAKEGVTLLTGYNLRYHPGLIRLKHLLDEGAIGKPLCATIHCGSYLPDWRPGFDYRKGYAASREQGGGVLLDCSHEIDYACWLFGEPVEVSCVAHNTGALEIETEDVADMAIRFAGGVQANIHLDYLNEHYRRECEVVGDKGTLQWRFRDGGAVICQPRHAAAFQTYAPRWEGDWTPDDMYRAELCHFLAIIEGEENPKCIGEDGLRALRVALAARKSAETGRTVRL